MSLGHKDDFELKVIEKKFKRGQILCPHALSEERQDSFLIIGANSRLLDQRHIKRTYITNLTKTTVFFH
jgi:hypothetical protein